MAQRRVSWVEREMLTYAFRLKFVIYFWMCITLFKLFWILSVYSNNKRKEIDPPPHALVPRCSWNKWTITVRTRTHTSFNWELVSHIKGCRFSRLHEITNSLRYLCIYFLLILNFVKTLNKWIFKGGYQGFIFYFYFQTGLWASNVTCCSGWEACLLWFCTHFCIDYSLLNDLWIIEWIIINPFLFSCQW